MGKSKKKLQHLLCDALEHIGLRDICNILIQQTLQTRRRLLRHCRTKTYTKYPLRAWRVLSDMSIINQLASFGVRTLTPFGSGPLEGRRIE